MIRRLLAIGCGGALTLLLLAAVGVFLVLRTHRLKKTQARAEAPIAQPGDYKSTLSFGGREREYIVHVPPGADASKTMALVIALHGGGGTADRTDDLMQLTPVADREGFFVVFPQGVGKSWNDGRPDTPSDAVKQNVDDVGFIKALVVDLETRLPIDPKRVYATGISNGAMMSTHLACEAADVIAAVAVVAGTGQANLADVCHPGRPVPFMAFNGADDPLVPYNGGQVTGPLGLRERGLVISVDGMKQVWVANNGCSATPTVTQLPDLDSGDGTRVTLEAYSGCSAGADLAFYRIDGGGHTWPGGRQYLPERLIGRTSRDIDASETIWRFFAAHPAPA